MDQLGKVANPARGQLNKEMNIPLSPCVAENLVSRDGFSRPVPRQPAHLHTQAEHTSHYCDSSAIALSVASDRTEYTKVGATPVLFSVSNMSTTTINTIA